MKYIQCGHRLINIDGADMFKIYRDNSSILHTNTQYYLEVIKNLEKIQTTSVVCKLPFCDEETADLFMLELKSFIVSEDRHIFDVLDRQLYECNLGDRE